jgi:CarboxypepD_reg-like domain
MNMISKKFCSLLLLLLCTIGMSYAQQQINGRVVDDQALPVPGVVVSVKGSSVKLTTDEKGNFAIPMVEKQTKASLIV